MKEYEQTVLERIYQSFVCGGDSLNFKLSKEKNAAKLIAALNFLEQESYITILSKTDSNIKAAVTDKGISFGNSAV